MYSVSLHMMNECLGVRNTNKDKRKWQNVENKTSGITCQKPSLLMSPIQEMC